MISNNSLKNSHLLYKNYLEDEIKFSLKLMTAGFPVFSVMKKLKEVWNALELKALMKEFKI